MDAQTQRMLLVLEEVEQNPVLTQRLVAKKLGMALGLCNLYLKRLVRKGYVKVTTCPGSRWRYLLTPRGLAEKSRLTYEYLHYSLHYYRDIRKRLQGAITTLEQAGAKRIVVVGVGELAELAFVSLHQSTLVLVGFVAEEPKARFLSYPCGTIEALPSWNVDAVLLSEVANWKATRAQLIAAGIPAQKIVSVVE